VNDKNDFRPAGMRPASPHTCSLRVPDGMTRRSRRTSRLPIPRTPPMEIPQELVPAVRELIAKHRRSAWTCTPRRTKNCS